VETLVIERKALPKKVQSFIKTKSERISFTENNGRVTVSPVIDPDDYDNTTDYLCAIPGFVEKIIKEQNEPLSESIPLEEIWPDV
jgi:hypothetical protein